MSKRWKDDGDGEDKEQRAYDQILAHIVQGWEGTRGAEDVRVRASALAVLAGAVEANIVGVGPALVTATTDLSVVILQLEREPGKAILRRAAVSFVMSLVRALHAARQARRALALGFGDVAGQDTIRILGYVAQTDCDGLVREHAQDVLESLGNWQAEMLTPAPAPKPGGRFGIEEVD